MSQSLKSAYYQALKGQDVPLSKPYREFTIAELKQAYDALRAGGIDLPAEPVVTEPDSAEPTPTQFPGVPVAEKDPTEMAGQRVNTQDRQRPIRIDDQGRAWFQEEVTKPSVPQPRGRRVQTYIETGVTQGGVRSVDTDGAPFVETFELSGTGAPRTAEVKVTLPSFQVGNFLDPRFPFRIHIYNNNMGFDLFEVQDFYGGPELVPSEVKRKYVENVLCFDMPSVIRAIEAEDRRLQLQGSIGAYQ